MKVKLLKKLRKKHMVKKDKSGEYNVCTIRGFLREDYDWRWSSYCKNKVRARRRLLILVSLQEYQEKRGKVQYFKNEF